MDKAEHITAVLSLYDEIDRLEREIEIANITPVAEFIECDSNKGTDELTAAFIGAGKKQVYKDSTNDWYVDFCVRRDEETGAIEYTSFEKWRNKYVNSVPDFMSRTRFYSIFNDWLKRDYEKKTEDELARFKMKEATDD